MFRGSFGKFKDFQIVIVCLYIFFTWILSEIILFAVRESFSGFEGSLIHEGASATVFCTALMKYFLKVLPLFPYSLLKYYYFLLQKNRVNEYFCLRKGLNNIPKIFEYLRYLLTFLGVFS